VKILFDLNIWIDIAIRPKRYPDSSNVYLQISGKHIFFLPACGYTTIYYLLEKVIGREGTLEFMERIFSKGVEILPFTKREIETARKFRMKDHENACLAATAFTNDCDYILTRNEKDFQRSLVPALLPSKALKIL